MENIALVQSIFPIILEFYNCLIEDLSYFVLQTIRLLSTPTLADATYSFFEITHFVSPRIMSMRKNSSRLQCLLFF